MKKLTVMSVVAALLAISAVAKAYDLNEAVIIGGEVSSAIAKSRREFSAVSGRMARAYDALRENVDVSKLTTEFAIPVWEYVDRAEDAATAYRRFKPKPLQPLESKENYQAYTAGLNDGKLPTKTIVADGEAAIRHRKEDLEKLRTARSELVEAVDLARKESDFAFRLSQELNAAQERGGAALEIFFSLAMNGESFALTAGGYEAFVVPAFTLRWTEAKSALGRLDDVISAADQDLRAFDEFIAWSKFMYGANELGKLSAAVERSNPYLDSPREGLAKQQLAEIYSRHSEVLGRVEQLRREADAIDEGNARLENARRIVVVIGAAASLADATTGDNGSTRGAEAAEKAASAAQSAGAVATEAAPSASKASSAAKEAAQLARRLKKAADRPNRAIPPTLDSSLSDQAPVPSRKLD